MKYCLIPCSILIVLLAAAVLTSRAVDTRVTQWRETLEQAQLCAQQDDWSGAQSHLRAARTDWDDGRRFLHLIAVHDSLDAPDQSFRRAAVYAREGERAEFLAATAELIGQLEILRAWQAFSLRNIL